MIIMFLLLMVEAGLTTDIFLNRDWEEVKFLHTQGDTTGCYRIYVRIADYF